MSKIILPKEPERVTIARIKLALRMGNDVPGVREDWRLVEYGHLSAILEWLATLDILAKAE